MEIQDLQAMIDQKQHELNMENQRGGLKNEDAVSRLESEIAELRLELEESNIDPVTARGEEEIAIFGVPLGAYFTDISDHINVRTVVLAKIRELMQDKQEIEENYNKLLEKYEGETQKLNEVIQSRDTELAEVKASLYESRLLEEDTATKRDNLYNEWLEAKQTIDDLNEKLATASAPKAPILTNLDGAAGYVKKEKRVIYDVQGKGKNKFTAKYADTDESFEDYTIYKDGKYQEVTAEEAPSFRTVPEPQQPEHSDEDHSYDIPDSNEVAYTAPAFREEADSTTSGLDQAYAGSEVAGKTVEERLQALELAVFGAAQDAA